MAFGMLLADAAAECGVTGSAGAFDRGDDCLDGFGLIGPRLLDGRLVEKISVAWHDVPLLTPSTRSPITVLARDGRD